MVVVLLCLCIVVLLCCCVVLILLCCSANNCLTHAYLEHARQAGPGDGPRAGTTLVDVLQCMYTYGFQIV